VRPVAQSATRLKEAANSDSIAPLFPDTARSELAEPSLKVTDVGSWRASSQTLLLVVNAPARQNWWTRRVTAPGAPLYTARQNRLRRTLRHPVASAEMGEKLST
jgi:hypothetical protein